MKAILLHKVGGVLIRHGLTVAGGWLIASGLTDETTWQEISGALATAAGLALSALEKSGRV